MYSQLSRCSAAKGSRTGLSLVGPTKVKARQSFLFTEGFLKVEINKSLRMRRSSVKMLGLKKTVTKMVTGCLRAMKFAICALCDLKVFCKIWKVWESVYVLEFIF